VLRETGNGYRKGCFSALSVSRFPFFFQPVHPRRITMKRKLAAIFLAGIFLASSLAFAAGEPGASKNEDEKLRLAREQIAEDAAFIRKTNSDPRMTSKEKKASIADFMRKQNEKIR
jgi:hypothetical protein